MSYEKGKSIFILKKINAKVIFVWGKNNIPPTKIGVDVLDSRVRVLRRN